MQEDKEKDKSAGTSAEKEKEQKPSNAQTEATYNDLASRRVAHATHERNETISRLGSEAQTPPNLRFLAILHLHCCSELA